MTKENPAITDMRREMKNCAAMMALMLERIDWSSFSDPAMKHQFNGAVVDQISICRCVASAVIKT